MSQNRDLSKFNNETDFMGPWSKRLARKKADKTSEQMSSSHEENLARHTEHAEMNHRHALELLSAGVEGRIKEVKAYHRLAESGKPFQAKVGDSSVSMVKRTPKARVAKAAPKAAPKKAVTNSKVSKATTKPAAKPSRTPRTPK